MKRQIAELFLDSRHVKIHDARLRSTTISLETNGFTLLQHHSGVEDWYNKDLVQKSYAPEVVHLVRTFFPTALQIVPLEHITRNESGNVGQMGPHRLVHNDFTAQYIKQLCGALGMRKTTHDIEKIRGHGVTLKALQKSRVIVLNLWRSISCT